MGTQGGIATLLLLLLLACQPQPLRAGPLAGGKPCPASPPQGWSGEELEENGSALGAGWAGRDGTQPAALLTPMGAGCPSPSWQEHREAAAVSGRVFGPDCPAGKVRGLLTLCGSWGAVCLGFG